MEEEWGCIARKIEQTLDIADAMNWEELKEKVLDASEKAEKETDPSKLFFNCYQFFMRLYYRVKVMKEPEPFNVVQKTTVPYKHQTVDAYRVLNYDYNMFMWAKERVCCDTITNNYFVVMENELSEQERASFDKKCENNYK